MNGYFFALVTTNSQVRPTRSGRGHITNEMQVWSGRETHTVCAETLAAAQAILDKSIAARGLEKNPMETKIHEMMAVPFVGELLTEKGTVPLDWPHIAHQTIADVKSIPMLYMEQGYWLDDASLNLVQSSVPDVEQLRQALPDHTRSGLNWTEERQFYFQFNVLRPAAPAPVAVHPESAVVDSGTADAAKGGSHAKLTPIDATVLVRARNSAVAAWLWFRYASAAKRAAAPIQMEAWNAPASFSPETAPDGN